MWIFLVSIFHLKGPGIDKNILLDLINFTHWRFRTCSYQTGSFLLSILEKGINKLTSENEEYSRNFLDEVE